MTSSNNAVYLCKEVFDENSEPTKTEIEEQAYRLGIDPVKELHLLSVAKQCLLEPLPSNWLPCYNEKENTYFYYNNQSKKSQWEHPLDGYYRQIVEKIRSEDSSTGQDISLNVILDEDNLLDTMYHTKNNNYEKKAVTEKRTVRFKTPIEESLDLDNSDDNMKFLGPIKLNTPYTAANVSSNLQNLPQFSTINTFDTRNTASRSVLSKYNILQSKDESSRKSDLGETIKTINDFSTMSVDYNTGKENLRKIDITLTESSDRSESTSSEIQTDNLNSDYERNDLNEKGNVVTTVHINKRHEKNDILNNDGKSSSNNINEFKKTTQLYNVKKDDLVSDSGNSTGKDSKILQSSNTTNSFSATKSKMAEITQRFPLNQFTNETKLLKIKSVERDEDALDLKSNHIKTKYESTNDSNEQKKSLLNADNIKVMIENHCDSIKNKMEDTIKTKENIFREELIKKIDDIIRKQNDNFEKHIEARHHELFTKNESELKNLIKNMQDKTENLLVEKYDKKYVQNVSNSERMCAENLIKFQKDLENYSETFKNQIQTELDVISNELKKEFHKNSETITSNLNTTLGSYKNVEMEKLKKFFEQTTENIKRDTDVEIHQFNLELKEKLKTISEDKTNYISEQLDLALREEISLVKNRVNENCQLDINKTFKHKSQSNVCVDCSKQDSNSKHDTVDNRTANNYSDIRKKIQYCSNELSDALQLIKKMSPSNECPTDQNMSLSSNKCTVSCQTENIISSHLKQNLNEYTYPEFSHTPILNDSYDFNSKYTDYWNQAKTSGDVCSNYMTTYSQIMNPLDILSQEELKVKAAEQNIGRLINTFDNLKHSSVYHIPSNTNIYHQNKFAHFYQPLTSKQIAYDRTKHLREWLYKADLNNKYK